MNQDLIRPRNDDARSQFPKRWNAINIVTGAPDSCNRIALDTSRDERSAPGIMNRH